VFDWSGVPVSHIRPTLFSEWMLYGAAMIRQGPCLVPFGTGRHAPTAAEDQARVIVGILENPKAHAGKTYPLVGPVECNHKEISQIIGRGSERKFTSSRFQLRSMLRYGEILSCLPINRLGTWIVCSGWKKLIRKRNRGLGREAQKLETNGE
jgi:uncharacterized protein YbjT (DUF2867 family)